jgi:hypothetical protein
MPSAQNLACSDRYGPEGRPSLFPLSSMLNLLLGRWSQSGDMRARFRAFLVLNCIFLLGTSNASADISLHPATRALINKFFNALTPPISQRKLVIAEVATLGCPQDGQAGPQDAPTLPKSTRVIFPEGMGSSLVYYSAHEAVGSGVLAPRDWDCFGLYGSGGSTLYVTPPPAWRPNTRSS